MADRRLGIFLGRDRAEAVYAIRRRRASRVLARGETRADGPFWNGDITGLGQVFRKLSRALPSEARRADVRQSIALPDPLVTEDRLSFQDFPDSTAEARELILWRVAREHRRPAGSFSCAWQVERRDTPETRVLVRITEKRILDAVLDAAGSNGIFPTRVDGWSGFLLNGPEVATGEAGARVWANEAWWTLVCWARTAGTGGAGLETLVHSEWRGSDAELPAIGEKVARLIRAFALSSDAGKLPLAVEADAALSEAVRSRIGDAADLWASGVDFAPASSGGADCVAFDTA